MCNFCGPGPGSNPDPDRRCALHSHICVGSLPVLEYITDAYSVFKNWSHRPSYPPPPPRHYRLGVVSGYGIWLKQKFRVTGWEAQHCSKMPLNLFSGTKTEKPTFWIVLDIFCIISVPDTRTRPRPPGWRSGSGGWRPRSRPYPPQSTAGTRAAHGCNLRHKTTRLVKSSVADSGSAFLDLGRIPDTPPPPQSIFLRSS